MTNENSLGGLKRINKICDRFEDVWVAGQRPNIADFLAEEGDEPSTLFAYLLEVEVDYRQQAGESPLMEDYLPQYVEFEDTLHQVLDQTTKSPADDQVATVDLSRDTKVKPSRLSATSGQVCEGSMFGDYLLQREIARGGMGVVYQARQEKAGRTVALKMILSGLLANRSEVDRFYAEARAAARLEHPNIVPVFDVGEIDGQHYFSMGYVDGQSVKERVNQGVLEPIEAAELLATTAEAIHYAHSMGIVHRDLKPANVLLDSNGAPRVTDFGLAKTLDAEHELTMSGQLLGTPQYMPPEQASGTIGLIGPRSDVYSLGAMLYNMLTGVAPFQAASPMETIRQVLEREPAPPRQINSAIPLDLQTICLKCLAKEPDRRYQTAQELAEDLHRWRRGEPIMARPVGRVERALRWCRRNPVISSLGAVITALVLVLAVGGPLAAIYQSRLKEEAQTAQDQTAVALRQSEGVAQYFVESIGRADPTVDSRQIKVVDTLEAAAERLKSNFNGDPLTKAKIATTLGRTMGNLGQYSAAVDQLRLAESIYKDLAGVGDPNTLITQSIVGHYLAAEGKLNDALKVLTATREEALHSLERHDPIVLKINSELADVYAKLGRHEEAIGLLNDSLEILESTLGEDDEVTMSAVNMLANAYRRDGRDQEAIHWRRELVVRRERTRGKDDQATFEAKLNLALLESLHDPPQLAAAREEAKKGWRRNSEVYGDEHPETLSVRANYGVLCSLTGMESEGKQILLSLIDDLESQLGPSHPKTILIFVALGDACQITGDFEQAETYLRRAVAATSSNYGANHPDALEALAKLASLHIQLGRFEDAVAIYSEALPLMLDKFSQSHSGVNHSLMEMAAAQVELGNTAEADRWIEVLEKRVKESELQPKGISDTFDMAVLAAYKGDSDRAIELGDRAVEISQAQRGPHHLKTIQMLNFVASERTNAGRLLEMRDEYEQLLPYLKEQMPEGNRDILIAVAVMSDILMDANEVPAMIKLLEALMPIATEKLPGDKEITIPATIQLAGSLINRGDVKRGGQMLKPLAGHLLEQAETTSNDRIVITILNLGYFFQLDGEFEKGAELMSAGLQALRRIHEPGSQLEFQTIENAYDGIDKRGWKPNYLPMLTETLEVWRSSGVEINRVSDLEVRIWEGVHRLGPQLGWQHEQVLSALSALSAPLIEQMRPNDADAAALLRWARLQANIGNVDEAVRAGSKAIEQGIPVDIQPPQWTVLPGVLRKVQSPSQLSIPQERELNVAADGSISASKLGSWANYDIRADAGRVKDVSAIRLEILVSPETMPGERPALSGGQFLLLENGQLETDEKGQYRGAVACSRAWASYARSARQSHDGQPMHAGLILDLNKTTWWQTPNSQPASVIFEMARPIQPPNTDPTSGMMIGFASVAPQQPPMRRFRLSTTQSLTPILDCTSALVMAASLTAMDRREDAKPWRELALDMLLQTQSEGPALALAIPVIEGAIKHLEDKSEQAKLQSQLACVLMLLSRREEAATAWQRAVNAGMTDRQQVDFLQRVVDRSSNLPIVLDICDLLIAGSPENDSLHLSRGHVLARMQRWNDARTAFEQAGSSSPWERWRLAFLQLKTNQTDAFSENGTELHETWEHYESLRIALLGEFGDPQQLLKRIKTYGDDAPFPLLRLAQLRAGEAEEAAKPLSDDSNRNPFAKWVIAERFARSMALYDIGQIDQAKQAFAVGELSMRYVTTPEELTSDWWDWLTCDVLRDQAIQRLRN